MHDDIRVNASAARGLIVFSRAVGAFLVLVSLAVLATWLGGAGPLQALVGSKAGMRAAAAVGGLLAGASLLVAGKRPRAGIALSLLVALLGGHGLLAYAPGFDGMGLRWLDGVLPSWSDRTPGRMTGLAALNFLLLGLVGMAATAARAIWLREASALAVIAATMASIASYGLVLAGDSASLLLRLPIMTAMLQFLLALAWMASAPTSGLTRVAVADSAGGAFARRLILPALLLPMLLTFVFEAAQAWFGVSESLALALAAVATGGLVAAMIIWVAFLLDRSERQRRAVLALRADASTDGLTGLANRRALDAALVQALQGSGKIALLMLDLDHFKGYNDNFGHQAGDDVLRETGQLLRAEVRPGDLAARYGGEEFVILLAGGDAARAALVGQRTLDAFRAWPWPNRPVTASIGATLAVPGDTPESLLRRADGALYGGKQAGRDRYVFDAAVQDSAP